MTKSDADMIISAIAAKVKAMFAERDARIAALEEQAKAVPGVSYRGIWNEGETYPRGSLATHSGSLWYTDRETKAKPGASGESWRLVAKRGRDGRDALRGAA